MWKNYFVSAWRNAGKNKLHSVINILGLAVGIASCILILLFVRAELHWDGWVDDPGRVVSMNSRFDLPGRPPTLLPGAPSPLAPALAEAFPEVEAYTRVFSPKAIVITDSNEGFSERFDLVDEGFLEVFPLDVVAGDLTSFTRDLNSVIVSSAIAEKYFGKADPIGRRLRIEDGTRGQDFAVAGVFDTLPRASTLRFDIIALFDETTYAETRFGGAFWGAVAGGAYLRLAPGASVPALNAALPAFEDRALPDLTANGMMFALSKIITFTALAASDWHLFSGDFATGNSGSFTAVLIFAAIALMILAIACINFTNLATARASRRAREVALRKTLGARRTDLVGQFLGESMLAAVLALVLALLMVELVIPVYGSFLERDLTLDLVGPNGIALQLSGLLVFVGLLAGVYPALYLSGFRPTRVFHAVQPSGRTGSSAVRHGLVIVQFAISIALIAFTVIVYAQYSYARSTYPGFERADRLVIRGLDDSSANAVWDTLRQEFGDIAGVTAVTASSGVPGDGQEINAPNQESNIPIRRVDDRSGEPVVLGYVSVDFDFFDLYGMPFVAGRDFSRAFGQDLVEDAELAGDEAPALMSAVLNEAAVRQLGYPSPQAALGKELIYPGLGGSRPVVVVGIVKDAHFRSLHEPIRAALFLRTTNDVTAATLSFTGVSGREVLAQAEAIWRRHVPGRPFVAESLDDNLGELYRQEAAQATIFTVFAALAILVACLGAYGLASFAAERRGKEIALRKVMGAGVTDILRLFVWQFSKPVLIANLIAWPAAAYFAHRWLEGFAYRIELALWPFLFAGAAALAIALVTISGHAIRVARTHPAMALREE